MASRTTRSTAARASPRRWSPRSSSPTSPARLRARGPRAIAGSSSSKLFALADRLGARYVATGHYARIVRDDSGALWLAQGRDLTKDQSYFLFATSRPALARLLFPVGESTKAEVRAEAVARRLPGATKGESQELCFVGTRPHAYAAFVEARAGSRIRPGVIVGADGQEVGQHTGIHHFTVGQRKGLGVAGARPLYVTRVDAATGRVSLGEEAALACESATVEDAVLAPGVELPRRARVRVRYRHDAVAADLVPWTCDRQPEAGTTTLRVRFDEPVRAVTRGQVAVFYDEGRVLGGGRITGTEPP